VKSRVVATGNHYTILGESFGKWRFSAPSLHRLHTLLVLIVFILGSLGFI
jgi:hypothetical protein